jgi:cystathionine beta-synthase
LVTFICDTGNKYLSRMYNDSWMVDQGFIDRARHGDLRDLVGRRHEEGAVVTVGPDDRLMTAYARMRLYDISQLPVLENGRLAGLIDEWDLLMAVGDDGRGFALSVPSAMSQAVETLDIAAPVSALPAIFDQGQVAVVVDNGRFYGLITRMDMLNYLRQRAH